MHVDTTITFQDGTTSRIRTDLVLETLIEPPPSKPAPAEPAELEVR